MRRVKVINVFLVASVSAVLHGAMAVLLVPVMSLFFLAQHASHAQLDNAITENAMVLAVIAPVAWAAVGFAAGAFMGFVWNMFAGAPIKPQIVRVPVRVHAVSQRTAA